MTSRLLFSCLLLTICCAAQAQVFKWVDANGKVTYSDVPPPQSATRVDVRPLSPANASAVALPFELSQAVKNMPVTLYTSGNCAPCDDGRSYLKQNGIPFAELTVSTDADIKKVSTLITGTQFPVLTVGRSQLTGYSAADWRKLLSFAGYPETNMLPAAYQYPAPKPVAPIPAAPTRQIAPPTPAAPADDPNAFHF